MNIPKRVQRGLAWLKERGPDAGLQVSSLVAQIDNLRVQHPHCCVVGLASGGATPGARSRAFYALGDARGDVWMWRHGFTNKPGDPGSIYALLDAEWRRALTLEEAPF